MAPLSSSDAETFARCMNVEGVAVFPADTVYGLACEPESKEGVRRLYALKRRDRDQPAAVMFFQPSLALAALPELGLRTRDAMLALLPGPVTLLLPNPARRYPLACGNRPEVLGLRVPALPPALAALEAVAWPILQSSANPAGAPAPRRIADLDPGIGEAVDLVLDGGELPGVSSTIVDLTDYEGAGVWTIAREGAFTADEVAAAL